MLPRMIAWMTPHGVPAHPTRRFAYGATLFCCLGLLVLPVLLTHPVLAQQQPQRVAQGKVVDKSGAVLKGATVYLKDGHTLSVRSYIAADDGSYRFGQLAQGTDYQLWAESNGKKSSVKNISSFDTRNEFNITLKVEK